MQDKIQEIIQRVKSALKTIDYSDQDIDQQMKLLEELIVLTILKRITTEYPEFAKISENEYEQFIKQHYQDAQLNEMVINIGKDITDNFIKEITKNLDKTKKDQFFACIQQ